MVYGKDVKPGELEEVIDRVCKLYPDISRKNHEMIVTTTYDNYFSKEGMFKWYEETAPKLTPDVLDAIKMDLHPFFYRESHFDVYDGYVALALKKN